jgi:hypothetical protein
MLAHLGGVRLDSAGMRGARAQAIFPVMTAESMHGRVA